MRKVVLGKTGLSITRLCFGCGRISPLSNEDGAKLLMDSYRKGVRFWDSADCYGTHRHIKEALKKLPRKHIIIQTKVCANKGPQADSIIKQNIRELGTRPDVLLLHSVKSVSDWNSRQGAYRALLRAKAKGLCKAVGFSTHCSPAAVKAAVKRDDVDVILASVHPRYIKNSTPSQMLSALRAAHASGKGIIAMKLLGAGHDISRFEDRLRKLKSLPYIDSFNLGISTHDQLAKDVRLLG